MLSCLQYPVLQRPGFWISLCVCLLGLGRGTCQENVVHGMVSYAMGYQSMPKVIFIDIILEGKRRQLDLFQDKDTDLDCPVYTLSPDQEGKAAFHRVSLEKSKNFAVYHDMKHAATFQAVRSDDVTGKAHLDLDGIVVYADKKCFHVKSINQFDNQTNNSTNTASRSSLQNSTGDKVNGSYIYFHQRKEFKVHSLEENVTRDDPFVLLAKPMDVFMRNKRSSHPLPRKSRYIYKLEVTEDVYIDVIGLIDYRNYLKWYTERRASNEQESDIVRKIRQHYAFIFSGINMLYKSISSLNYTIHVRLVAMGVATSVDDSQWTEFFRDDDNSVQAGLVINDLSLWVQYTKRSLEDCDHVMLFTGCNLKLTIQGKTTYGIKGIAYYSTLCRDFSGSVSVIEDTGSFFSINIGAHELGHSVPHRWHVPIVVFPIVGSHIAIFQYRVALGVQFLWEDCLSAEHDGTENTCRHQDMYIMEYGGSTHTRATSLNRWRFSPCSIKYFHTYLTNQIMSEKSRSCLYLALPIDVGIPNVTSLLAGQVYPPDEQCRQTFGPKSSMCQNKTITSLICEYLYCQHPTNINFCYEITAAQGTSCGDNKTCENGRCVDVGQPPLKGKGQNFSEDGCLSGDYPGVHDELKGQNCSSFIASSPAACYRTIIFNLCCRTCSNYSTSAKDCLFGDRNPIVCDGIKPTGSSCKALNYDCCSTCSEAVRSGCEIDSVVLSRQLAFYLSAMFLLVKLMTVF